MTAGHEITQAANVFSAKITLTGPTSNGSSDRGIKKMQVGWIQNVANGNIETSYWDGTVQSPPGISNTWYVDNGNKVAEVGVKPAFYSMLDYTNPESVSIATLTKPNSLVGTDNPNGGFRLLKDISGVSTAERNGISGIYEGNFRLWICAKTTDFEVTANSVYTPYRYAEWSWHLEDNALNTYPQYDWSGHRIGGYSRGTPSLPDNSIVTLDATLQNWISGLPIPVTTGTPANHTLEHQSIEDYLNIP